MSTNMILVYGASGFTGTLVVEELVSRGHTVVVAGRDRARLDALAARFGGLEVRQAQVHDPVGLEAALRGAKIVISCAGPFAKVGEPVLRAAIANSAHYLDTTGEQAFMREMYERYDSRARKAGVAAVSGFAFEIALGDWVAERACELVRAQVEGDQGAADAADRPVDEVAVGYAFSSPHVTPGTRASILDILSKPTYVWSDDRWEGAALGSKARTFLFPPPFGDREGVLFPSGEVITVPRHVRAGRVETYLSFGEASPFIRTAARVAGFMSPFVPAIMASPLGAMAKSHLTAARAPTEEERRETQIAVVAEASLSHHRSRVALSGSDPYALTARIIAYGVERLLGRREDQEGLPCGVLAPSHIAPAEESIGELVGEGLIAEQEL